MEIDKLKEITKPDKKNVEILDKEELAKKAIDYIRQSLLEKVCKKLQLKNNDEGIIKLAMAETYIESVCRQLEQDYNKETN